MSDERETPQSTRRRSKRGIIFLIILVAVLVALLALTSAFYTFGTAR